MYSFGYLENNKLEIAYITLIANQQIIRSGIGFVDNVDLYSSEPNYKDDIEKYFAYTSGPTKQMAEKYLLKNSMFY